MKKLIEKILLKESIEFNGSITELKEKIQIVTERKFKFEWISENDFKILSKISVGTFILNSNPGYFEGIRGFGKLTELKNGKTIIDLNTKLRVELYFAGILPTLTFIVSFLSSDKTPLWSFFLIPVVVLWFWFIYRCQEEILFRKFRNYIKIE
ncbi:MULTISPECIES: hypothetical protein [unclassified Flavobacterium]|uniref:hypothetical protein n=1 Tax=unclassified Flavobacterium TaxID=196869 RepID=UPI0006AB87C7|nr:MULTISPECIES: hypothetical protein [unclassified Flavobacterium]KOP40287.1 hypothetical protein AKO67_01235 [Flavobacterium sp. VMW]OWU91324.1 hypothetical protein APR43_07645 [Flavobacterium sp. NLM]